MQLVTAPATQHRGQRAMRVIATPRTSARYTILYDHRSKRVPPFEFADPSVTQSAEQPVGDALPSEKAPVSGTAADTGTENVTPDAETPDAGHVQAAEMASEHVEA